MRRQKGKIEKDKGDNPSPINPTGSSARALLVRISFFFDFGGGWCVVDCGPLFFSKNFHKYLKYIANVFHIFMYINGILAELKSYGF